MCMLKSEKHCSIALDSESLDTAITVTMSYVYTAVVLSCRYLNVGFTNREETVILILVNEKIKRFGGNLRPPSHQKKTNARLGTVSGQHSSGFSGSGVLPGGSLREFGVAYTSARLKVQWAPIHPYARLCMFLSPPSIPRAPQLLTF